MEIGNDVKWCSTLVRLHLQEPSAGRESISRKAKSRVVSLLSEIDDSVQRFCSQYAEDKSARSESTDDDIKPW
jgi:hypothetical protein